MSICRSVAIPDDLFATGMPQLLNRGKNSGFSHMMQIHFVGILEESQAQPRNATPARFDIPENEGGGYR